MAAPTKNFQDPTGKSGMLAPLPSPRQPRISVPFGGALTILPWVSNRWSINLPGIGFGIAPQSPKQPRIPIPPMGRQMLLTFPPIYRERGAAANRPAEGQTWPRFATD